MIPAAVAARFRVVSELGQGGFGAVYLAQQLEPERPVALKVLLTVSDEELVRRFAREAKLTALLDHPGVVRLLEHGVDESVPWIAYEHVPGGNLRQRMAAGPMSLADALALAIQITEGLGAAHAAGLVHRDVKPENVLLTADGRAKIADFGIARPSADRSWHTTPGMVLGTPWYIAPETLRDSPAPSSDLYAVGIILWELIERVPPCTESDPMAVMRWHVAPDRPRLGGVPRTVAAVVEKAICMDPKDRYDGAAALATALREALAYVEAGARPPTATTQRPVPEEALVAGELSTGLARIPSRPDHNPTIRVRSRPDAVAGGHLLRSNSRPDAAQSGPVVRPRSRPDVRIGTAARERGAEPPARARVYGLLAALTLALGVVWLFVARRPAPAPTTSAVPRPPEGPVRRAAAEFDHQVTEWLKYHDGSWMNPMLFIDHGKQLSSMADAMYLGLEPLTRRFDGWGDPLDDYQLMLLVRRSALAWNWSSVNKSYKREAMLIDEGRARGLLQRFGKALLAARLRALDGHPQFTRFAGDLTQSVFDVARGNCGLAPRPAWLDPLDRELTALVDNLPASPQRASLDLDPVLKAAWAAGHTQFPTAELLATARQAVRRLDATWNVETPHRWLDSEHKRLRER